MGFARTDTQIMVSDMAGRLFGDLNAFEHWRLRLAGEGADRLALWAPIAEQGLLGAMLPESAGGFGGGMRDLATVLEAVGRHLVIEPVLAQAVAGAILHAGGIDPSDLLSGDRIVVLAHEEGLDPYAPRRTVAACVDGGWRLSGAKIAVRHANLAHAFVVSAQDEGGTAAVFLVETESPGLRSEAARLMDASSSASLVFESVPAVKLDVTVERFQALSAHLACGLAVESVAICEVLCARTFAYLKTRRQFGMPLAAFQALQHRVADMVAAIEMARALVDRAVDALDAGGGLALASAAKAIADEAGRLIGHEAVQMHGGMGVSDELDVSHFMRRLAVIRASHGSAAIHRARFADLIDEDRFAVDGEQDRFRSEIREFVAQRLPADIAAKGERGLEYDKDDFVRWQKLLRERDWFAGAWPVEHGGGGWDLEHQLAFVQEAGRAGAPLIIPYGVNMVGPVIYTFGNEAQKARHLPAILSSDIWWCQGYSEPNAGSDLASLKTTAVRDGDYYVVNGTKMWTTEAHWADWMHCLVRTDRDAKPQAGISFLLIDMRSPGIEIRPIVTIDGQHHTNQIFLDDVRVPIENLVGHEGQGWSIAKFLLANERVAIADTGPKLRLLADIKGMFARLRKAEGASDSLALLADRLADAEIQLMALCALEADYVRGWQRGADRNGPEASILKVRGTEILQLLSELALSIEGPCGAVHDPAALHRSVDMPVTQAETLSAMAHHYLYSRCWSIFGGTNEIQRGLIARASLA